MELPEAKSIARDEIIFIVVEVEKQKIYLEMKADEARFERSKEQEAGSNPSQQEKQAAKALFKAYRRFSSMKKAKSEVRSVYEKHFDTTHKLCYYFNRKSGVASWDKPKLLGEEEIGLKDEWFVMSDKDGYPYYYNAKRNETTWRAPSDDVQICENIVIYSWVQATSPPPTGQCPNFATTNCPSSGRSLCASCLSMVSTASESH
jgi:hypothetical protein